MEELEDSRCVCFSKEEHEKIENKLNNPQNGIKGYIELLEWVNKEFAKEIKYIILLKYYQRHFGSKIKFARKSHVKKDNLIVDTFKMIFSQKSKEIALQSDVKFKTVNLYF